MTKHAFTLAEVLITLGIIGVVAAVTMPTLIKNYKIKAHETAFKKTDSMLQQALKMSVNELGYVDVRELNYIGPLDDPRRNIYIENANQIMPKLNEIFLSQFKGIKKLSNTSICQGDIQLHDFVGEKRHQSCGGQAQYLEGSRPVYLLNNGVAITNLWYGGQGWGSLPNTGIFLTFDTNGPYKGPNRLGYDIFTYVSVDKATPVYCNPIAGNSYQFLGCYFFAGANKSPLNSSEPYWNLLYKPLSYWENYNK